MNSAEYQRVRLWSGITSIGANLAMIWALAISATWWATSIQSVGVQLLVLTGIAVLVGLANLPFDILVGHATERGVSRTRQTLAQWLLDWSRERFWISLQLLVGFCIFWFNYKIPALIPVLILALVICIAAYLLMPWGQDAQEESPEFVFEPWLREELAKLNIQRQIAWFDPAEESVNGFVHPSGALQLSTTVATKLSPREAALLCYREEWHRRSGAWLGTLIIAIGWLLCGVTLGMLFPANSALQAALGGAAVVSSWCFLALFLWPPLDAMRVAQADRSLLAVASVEEVSELLIKLQQINATDIELSDSKTATFHPIPPLNARLKNLS